MKISSFDLNLFVIMNAIYTEGSLTKAAEVVGITQPAVSNALARLREDLMTTYLLEPEQEWFQRIKLST